MALLTITNGVDTIRVLPGAFNSYFKDLGFYVVDNESHDAEEINQVEDIKDVDKFEELLEKPLSQWSKSEIKEFAADKGIDISGTKNSTEAKEIIKQYLEQE